MFRLYRIFRMTPSLVLMLVVMAPIVAWGQPPTIEFTLANGRVIQADLIARTGDTGLAVRTGSAIAYIERQIAWASISQASIIGQELSLAELKAFSQLVAPQNLVAADFLKRRFMTDPAVQRAGAMRRPTLPSAAGVVADAWLSQTNPATSGEQLQVRVSAIDLDGNPVPVDGTAEIRFITAAAGNYVRDSGAIGHNPVELGRWTQRLSPQSQPSGVGSWRFDTPRAGAGGSAYGMLTVRLVVPGSGVFETVVDGIRRRNFRPVQDALRGEGGVRTLP